MDSKHSILKVLSGAMAVLLLLQMAGCGKEETEKKKKVVKKIIVTEDETDGNDGNVIDGDNTIVIDNRGNISKAEDSDEISSDDKNDTVVDRIRRELFKKTTDEKYVETFKPEFTSKNEKWNGPAGYSIVYSEKYPYALEIAKKLQTFFSKTDGVTLEIKKDSAEKQEKEILVGNTNRYTSKLDENKFAVTQKGQKLIFEGGHFAMTEKAADWFMTVKREKGKAAVLSGTADDFKATLSGGYKYVWGDEFDGSGIDHSKWDTEKTMMNGTQTLYVARGEDAEKLGTLNISGGRLKISAFRYFNQLAKEYNYVTSEINTWLKLSYLYGYAEIRAKVPMQQGAFPSWWVTNAWCPSIFSKLGYAYDDVPYHVEMDIFESFASDSTIVPNIHKWWQRATADKFKMPSGYHSEYPAETKKQYTFKNTTNLKNEYHTYGFKWTPEEMTVSVDGTEYMTFNMKNGFNGENEYNEYLAQPFFFIFTNYVMVPDYTDMNTNGKQVVPAEMPYEFFIDYIRLYQTEKEGMYYLGE